MLGIHRNALRISVVVGVAALAAIGGFGPHTLSLQSQNSVLLAAEPINFAADSGTNAGVEVIHRLMFDQSAAWNRGDIPTFMEAYWKSPELTFSSGGNVTRGWEATRDRYLTRYPDRATMGKLTFTELETRLVGDKAALTLGRWKLERGQPIDGNFSLVWQKFDDGWKIIHDHTSASTR